MKKAILFALILIMLLCTAAACEENTEPAEPETSTPEAEQLEPIDEPESDVEDDVDVEEDTPGDVAESPDVTDPQSDIPQSDVHQDETNSSQSGTYTIEQIQNALHELFTKGMWSDVDDSIPQVISAERTESDSDGIHRYRVEFKYTQSQEIYNILADTYKNVDPSVSMIRRDGDYTIQTQVYDFIDVDGEPVPAYPLSTEDE